MKRDGKLTDVQLIMERSDRQKNKNWKSMGVKPLVLLIIVLGLVSCAPPKPTPTPSVEVTPKPTTPIVKPTASPKPKSSATAPRSKTNAPQSVDDTSDQDQTSGGEAEPEYTAKNKAIGPAEKPQPTVIKPAPAVEPDIAPEPRMQDSIPPIQKSPTQTPIAPQPDSDPEPPPAR